MLHNIDHVYLRNRDAAHRVIIIADTVKKNRRTGIYNTLLIVVDVKTILVSLCIIDQVLAGTLIKVGIIINVDHLVISVTCACIAGP